ncbi:MAG: hypothetical protein IKR86_11540 [Candidatus Methanomethylophilaceae archaeon]|nr:hypothetical protein [Candidatus Methanomethylophilaceae archaeon]
MVVELASNNAFSDKLFSRGFILSKKNVTVNNWTYEKIDDWILCYDTLTQYHIAKEKGSYVAALGITIDTQNKTANTQTICENLLKCLSKTEESMFDYLDTLCGRFVIIYKNDKEPLSITQDATAMKPVYYSINEDVIASHYGLIQMVTKDTESELYRFYNTIDNKPWILPGDFTPFENIYGLTANHKLVSETRTIKRIWPRKPITQRSINEVTQTIHDILKKEAEIIASLYPKIALSLTGGKDSRLSLSLFHNHVNQVTCFIMSSYSTKCIKDVQIAQKICSENRIKFEVLDMESVSPNNAHYRDFSEVCALNHYHQHMRKGSYLAADKFRGYLHIQSSLVEIIGHRMTFDRITDNMGYLEISKALYPQCESKIINDAFKQYFERTELDNRMGYHLNDFLYWEYRMCHWLNAGCTVERDMAFDTLQLMNCRKILEMGLSVPIIYRKANTFAEKILQYEWPELCNHSPNSNYSIYDYTLLDYSVEISKLLPSFCSTTRNDIYNKIGITSCDFGFASCSSKEKDTIKLELTILTERTGATFLQVGILCPSKCGCSKKAYYEIILDGISLYTTDMNSYLDKVNNIDLLFKNTSSTHTLIIKIISDGNGSSPFLHIGPIHISKAFQYNTDRPMISASKTSYFNSKKSMINRTSDN